MSVRPVASGGDLDAYVAIWNELAPEDRTTVEVARRRLARDPTRLHLLAEEEGAPVGCGYCTRSDSEGRIHVGVRVRPDARRRGIGRLLLRELVAHAERHGYRWASAHVHAGDEGSLAFARRFGFEEVSRQVEQVLTLAGDPPPPPEVPAGIRLVTLGERRDLVEEAYDLAVIGFEDMPFFVPVTVSEEDWLRGEMTLPDGCFVAVAGDELVGYSGLLDRGDGLAEEGLTVVRRGWRRRGLGTLLKRAKIAWAARNGIREILSWSQEGHVAVRTLNERLGYADRATIVIVRTPLPLLAPVP